MKTIDKLHTITTTIDSTLVNEAKERRKNRDWLKKSQRLAVVILLTLKKLNMSQRELAKRLDVSPQYVNKIVKGREKLNLETISNLERSLGIELIKVVLPDIEQNRQAKYIKFNFNINLEEKAFDTYKIAK